MIDKLAILAAWSFSYDGEHYYTDRPHHIYITEILKNCDKLCLIVPVKNCSAAGRSQVKLVSDKIEVRALPYFTTHAGGMLHLKDFVAQISQAKKTYSHFYARVPDPYCWLPWIMGCKFVTMHVVGNSIHITWNSTQTLMVKLLKILLYIPEYFMTLLAAKFSQVFVNGRPNHLSLRKYFVKSTPVISSTVGADMILDKADKFIPASKLKLLYLGYLRKAKGVEKIIESLAHLEAAGLDYHLDIVGTGDCETQLKKAVDIAGLNHKVSFHGHVDDPVKLAAYYADANIFLFMSGSEGSPRVIIEAMAAQNVVISTRVGSLPSVFEDGREIIFVEHSARDLAEKTIDVIRNYPDYQRLAQRGQQKVKENYLLEHFIRQVFFYQPEASEPKSINGEGCKIDS